MLCRRSPSAGILSGGLPWKELLIVERARFREDVTLAGRILV